MVCSDCFTKLFTIQLNGGYTSIFYITCPLCRAPIQAYEVIDIDAESTLHPSSTLSQFYMTATVACSNKDCPEKAIRLIDINQHEMLYCPYRIIQCPSVFCNFEGSATSVEDHLFVCPNKRQYCDKCFSDYSITYREHHCMSDSLKDSLRLSLPYQNKDVMLPTNSRFRCDFKTALIRVKNMVDDMRSLRTHRYVQWRRVQRRYRAARLLPSTPRREERPPRGLLHITRDFLTYLFSPQ